jgi:hypothetical protein
VPNYFIVSTTDDKAPYLLLSQGTYNDTIERTKHFEKLGYRHYYVFAVKALPPNHYYPNCTQLALEAHIKPDDIPGYYTYSLGHELDNLPQDQALTELERAVDYLCKKRHQIEGRTVEHDLSQRNTDTKSNNDTDTVGKVGVPELKATDQNTGS